MNGFDGLRSGQEACVDPTKDELVVVAGRDTPRSKVSIVEWRGMPTPKSKDRTARRQRLKADDKKAAPQVVPGTVEKRLDDLARMDRFADARASVTHLKEHPDLSPRERILVDLVVGADEETKKAARRDLRSHLDGPKRLGPWIAWELGKQAYDDDDFATFLEVASRSPKTVLTKRGGKIKQTPALESDVLTMLRDLVKGSRDARNLLAIARRVPNLLSYAQGTDRKAALVLVLQLAIRCVALRSGAQRKSALSVLRPTILQEVPDRDMLDALASKELRAADLAQLAAQTGVAFAHSNTQADFIRSLARAARSDVIQQKETWEGLDLVEIAALHATEIVGSHFEPRPSWWDGRVKTVLAREGIGSVLRALHLHPKAAGMFEIQGNWLVESASEKKNEAESSIFQALSRKEIDEAVAAVERDAAAASARAKEASDIVNRELQESERRVTELKEEVGVLNERLNRGVREELVSRSAQERVAQTTAVEALIRTTEQIRLASTTDLGQAAEAATAAYRLALRELGALGVSCPAEVGDVVVPESSLYDLTSIASGTSRGIVQRPAYVQQVGGESVTLLRGLLKDRGERDGTT